MIFVLVLTLSAFETVIVERYADYALCYKAETEMRAMGARYNCMGLLPNGKYVSFE